MRRFVPLLVLVLATPAAAQTAGGPTDRGSWVLGGTASLSRSENDGRSATGISLAPSVLRFIANRIAVGGEFGLSYTDTDAGSSRSWRVGPAARFYFGESSAKVLKYVGAAVLFGGSNTSLDEPLSSEADASQWSVEGVAGLTFMLSRQVGISGEFFGQRSESTISSSIGSDAESKLTSYGVRFGLAAFIF
jgi:hypothetical protein